MQLPGMTVADLLTNDSFLNYCKGVEPDTRYWENYIKDNPAQQEIINNARELFENMFQAFAAADLEEQVDMLSRKISSDQQAPVVSITPFRQERVNHAAHWLVKTAAAAMILIISGYFVLTFRNPGASTPIYTYHTDSGEKKTIQLPDGSIVILNAGSRIQIDAGFAVANRFIKLSGEGFFDVKKNKALPFIVHTPDLQVRAIGTAFNVKAYPQEQKSETALIRGLAEVTLVQEPATRIMLHPNQKVQWVNQDKFTGKTSAPLRASSTSPGDDELVKKVTVTADGMVEELAWIENKLVFSDESFADIALQLERWYSIKVEFQDEKVSAYRFTATFEKESLQTLLDVLKESRDFNYKIIHEQKMTVKIWQ